MSPYVAAVLSAVAVAILLYANQDRYTQVSPAVWLPFLWLTICASRTVSQWLAGAAMSDSPGDVIEGSPLDASILAALLLGGIVVLALRGRVVRNTVGANGAVLVFLLYCALSCVWSDYPFVAVKRLFKAFGDLVMVLIVLTDKSPATAVKALLTRCGFVLIPLSILLIRYFPTIGREYSSWTGEAYNVGVATGKNGLGYVCLICGLGSFWAFLDAWRARVRFRARLLSPLLAQGGMLGLVVWLLRMANSATSLACFLIGAGLILFARTRTISRTPALVNLVVIGLLFIVVYGLLLNPSSGLSETVGRDSTLTGRTVLWKQVLALAENPFFGVGYESFWLGTRLEKMWDINWEHPNQAHNGYLELYLDLGWVGLVLLASVVVSGYWAIVHKLRQEPEIGSVRLAFLVVALIYNLTEHGFRELHPVWIMFLLAVTIVPIPSKASIKNRYMEEQHLVFPNDTSVVESRSPAGTGGA